MRHYDGTLNAIYASRPWHFTVRALPVARIPGGATVTLPGLKEYGPLAVRWVKQAGRHAPGG